MHAHAAAAAAGLCRLPAAAGTTPTKSMVQAACQYHTHDCDKGSNSRRCSKGSNDIPAPSIAVAHTRCGGACEPAQQCKCLFVCCMPGTAA